MLSSKIKLKQMLNNVGNITIYKLLIVTVSSQFSKEVLEIVCDTQFMNQNK